MMATSIRTRRPFSKGGSRNARTCVKSGRDRKGRRLRSAQRAEEAADVLDGPGLDVRTRGVWLIDSADLH
jgi:hypothetical protein